MKIALINENSQAAKNEMICATLKRWLNPWVMKCLITVCAARRIPIP